MEIKLSSESPKAPVVGTGVQNSRLIDTMNEIVFLISTLS